MRILVGFDGSPPARRAIEHAAQAARSGGHELVLVTVIPTQVRDSSLGKLMPAGLALPPQLDRTFEENARLRLDEVAKEISAQGLKVHTEVRVGDTAEELLLAAQQSGAGEIVIGRKSYVEEAQMGPNARAIRDGAKVPVTMVQ